MRRIQLYSMFFLAILSCMAFQMFSQNGQFKGKYLLILKTSPSIAKADSIEKFTKQTLLLDPETALSASKELLILSKIYKLPKKQTSAYNLIGLSLYYLGENNKATQYLDSLLVLAKQLNDTIAKLKAYTNLGMVYERLGNFEKAYLNNTSALQLSSSIGNQTAYANALGNTGNTCIRLKRYTEAIKLLEKSIEVHKSLDNKNALANQYNSIGTAYGHLKNEKMEIFYLKNAEHIYRELDNKNSLSTVLTNIGHLETERKNYQVAAKLLNEALMLKQEVSDKSGEAEVLNNLASLNSVLGNHKEATEFNNKAEQIFNKEHDLFGLAESKKMQALISQREGKFEKSNQEYQEYLILQDSAIGRETQLAVTDLREKYESEKKEIEIKLKNSELKEQTQKSFYSKIIFFSLTFIIILVAFLFYLRLKQKQKIRDEINRIEQENLKKQAVFEVKEKERNRMAAELHDNVGSSVSFISSKIDWLLQHQKFSEENRIELDNLKQSAKDVMGGLRETLWTLNSKSISNIDLCDKLKVYARSHLLCPLSIKEELNTEIEIPNEDVLAIYRCCQEIINNVNKHSKATQVALSFESSSAIRLKINFNDNGIGFEQIEKMDSYGLRNIKSRLNEIGATIEINSQKNTGTKIVLILK